MSRSIFRIIAVCELANLRRVRIKIHITNKITKKHIVSSSLKNNKQLLELENLRFMENKENILFVGSSGVGKTHLAISLGIAAAKKRYLTYFISCHDLIMQLKKAHNENRLEQRLKQFCKYKLLIIDEIGYLPIDKLGANLFFQLITKKIKTHLLKWVFCFYFLPFLLCNFLVYKRLVSFIH